MKILITGGSGFVARSIYNKLGPHEVVVINRQSVNLTDHTSVAEFFKGKWFDVIIHTAVVGGNRIKSDGPSVFYDNINMFYNIQSNRQHFGKLINLGTGAELNREFDINENSSLSTSFPTDHYGRSKNIISKICLNEPNFYNIRIFGLFGELEKETRFIKSSIMRGIKGENIIIHQNKIMDFFYIQDFCTLIKFHIENNLVNKELDCSYQHHYCLLDIAKIIKEIGKFDSDIILENKDFGNAYTGNPLDTDISLVGLRRGIENMIKYEKLK
jgi:nucleoside-diphosphate-sugar epimerase